MVTTAPADAATREVVRLECAAVAADPHKGAQLAAAMYQSPTLGPTFNLREAATFAQIGEVRRLIGTLTPPAPPDGFADPEVAAAPLVAEARAAVDALPADLARVALKVSNMGGPVDLDRADLPQWWVEKVIAQAGEARPEADTRRARLLAALTDFDLDPDDAPLRHAIIHRATRGRVASSTGVNADEVDPVVAVARRVAKGDLAVRYLDDGTMVLADPKADLTTGEITRGADGAAGDVDWKAVAARAGVTQAALLRQARALADASGQPKPGGLKTMHPDLHVALNAWVDQQAATPAPTPEPTEAPASAPVAAAEPDAADAVPGGERVVVVVHRAWGFDVHTLPVADVDALVRRAS